MAAPAAGRARVFSHYAAVAWLLPWSRSGLALALRAMLCALPHGSPCARAGVELHIVDDAVMSAANRRFMHCAGPTNVLSFPGGADLPGILLFSADTLARECLLYGQEPKRHTLRLLAHGVGHLAGLDHGPAMDDQGQACVAAAQKILRAEA